MNALRSHLRHHWHHHLAAWGILAAGFLTLLTLPAGLYTASYFQHRYGSPLPVPHGPAQPPPPFAAGRLPARAAIDTRWLPPPGDQGTIGACQCFAFSHQLGFLQNRRSHRHRRYSCRFWYTLVSHGQDRGSYLDQYPPLAGGLGGTLHREFDWPAPPLSLDPAVPAWTFPLARRHRVRLTTHVIQLGMGGNQSTLAAIDWWLAHGHPVNLDTPIFQSQDGFFAANNTGGWIDLPTAGAPDLGGHATTLIAYDRTLRHEGVTGWYRLENSWSTHWAQHGYAWISRRYVQRYGYGLEVLDLASAAARSGLPPVWSGMNHPLRALPPGFHLPTRPAAHPSYWYVRSIRARDSRADLGKLANAAGDRYHIWPVGLLAILGSECGLDTHSLECDRWGTWPDWSFGACQVTVATAAGFGLGAGIPASARLVRAAENNPTRCVFLAARVLHRYASYTGLNFPALAVAWNCGPGQPISFLLHPTGECASNHAHYLQWYAWAAAHEWRPRRGR